MVCVTLLLCKQYDCYLLSLNPVSILELPCFFGTYLMHEVHSIATSLYMWHRLSFSSLPIDPSPSNPPHGAIQSRRQHNACKYLAYIQETPRWERGLGGGQYFDFLQRLESNSPYYYSSLGNSLSSRLLALSLREAVHRRTRVSFCALIPIPGLRSIK
jgi:hypothetical protein